MSRPESGFVALDPLRFSEAEMKERARVLYEEACRRRSVRDFSDKPVPRDLIETLIHTAGTAPSGAHKQPWTFCAVSDPAIKRAIREAAEKEEFDNYHGRMSPEWLEDLRPLATDWHKPFLETAPWLIVVFKRIWEPSPEGPAHKNYYVSESVGIASGLLIQAIHHAGLVTLTHTPSPMNFLQLILGRPDNERPFLLLPVGFPAEGALVPDLTRKAISEILVWHEKDAASQPF